MKFRQKIVLKFLLLLFWVTAGFLFVQTVFAQFGVNEVGEEIALPSEDPRVVAARIIRVALGFLGIIAVVIVLYGGFVWMTAAGNEERLSKAKKILTSGLIGLVIIVMAFSITQFVLNKLMEAAGVGAPAGPPEGPPGGPPGLPSDAFVVRSIQPTGAIPIRNVVVRVVFNRDVELASLEGNFTVKKFADGSLVEGTINVSGSVVEFTPTASCPAPNEDRKCFEADTEFTVEATTGVRSTDGKNLVCGGLARACRENFTTGNLVDVTGPTVEITYPDPGQSVSADALVPVNVYATDDAGIAYLEYFADGDGAPWDPDNIDTPDTLVREYYGSRNWDTAGLTLLSRHTLTSKAFDIDANNTTSADIEVMVRSAHCFNTVRDADETDIDCGGADCGACDGGSCTSDYDCQSGYCIGGVCRNLPTITGISPTDGAPGNFITIFGRGFGTTAGSVYFFENQRASLPTTCATSATWQDNQIIVEVPVGAVDGPIRVEVPPPAGATASDYIDRTDDERGPILPNFDVNDIRRPGICAVDPQRGEPRTSVVVTGTQFGDTQGTSEINFGGVRAERVMSWAATSIGATVPPIAPGIVPVQVTVGEQNSNPVNFRVVAPITAPRILRFEPTSGPVGEYVTIFGSNFGDTAGTVWFKNATSGEPDIRADIPPAMCGPDWWKNDQIIIKVPSGAGTGIIRVGTHEEQEATTSGLSPRDFTVNTATPKPGICKITPDNGPVDLPVTITGERFATTGTVKFWENITATTTAWTDAQITTSVPSRATTGPVSVTVGTVESNKVNFTVRDCRLEGCPTGQECCRDGSCAIRCAALAGRGYYFWQFSTGQLPVYPQVVENCSNPPPPLPPSPSPWSERSGGDRSCVNADIAARFTTKIDFASLNTNNILVEKCSDQTCETRTEVRGMVTPIDVSDQEDGFIFRPTAIPPALYGLARNTWYQVTLKSGTAEDPGIRSCLGGRPGCPDGGFRLDGDRDGVEGGDYIWKFKTRDSDETCRIGSVGVTPYAITLREEGARQNYNGLCFAAEDVCLTLNCSGYLWAWSSSDTSKATITGSTGERETATARAETEVDRPVQITGSIPSEGKSGVGNLTIDFFDPKVVEKWPDCRDACLEAEIGVRFNTGMNATSVTDPANSALYIWRCGNGVVEPGEDCDDGNTATGDGCSDHCLNEGTRPPTCGNGRREIGEDCDGVPFPDRCDRTSCLNTGSDGTEAVCGNGVIEEGEDCDGSPLPARCASASDRQPCTNLGTDALQEVDLASRQYLAVEKKLILRPSRADLEPETIYRAVISGVVTSVSGVPLTELNYDTPGSSVGADSYSWTFKTKSDRSPCDVDRVSLNPKNVILSWIGQTQDYVATPFSAPDVCSPVGQRLRSLDYRWAWQSADTRVATITTDNRYPGCGNGVIEFGEDCDDGNTVSFDGCSGCPPGGGRPCGGAGACLNEGSTGTARCGDSRIEIKAGEDCDDGNVLSGDGCNSRCQHEGSVAGGTICGNGIQERGEDCDDGNTTPGDGCDSTCLNEGTRTDIRIDPYQVVTGLNLKEEDVVAGQKSSTTQIKSTEEDSRKFDETDLTLQCNFGSTNPCPEVVCDLTTHQCENSIARTCRTNADCELGVGKDSCCHFKPRVTDCDPSGLIGSCGNRTTPDVCRNAKISVTFDQLMDPASVSGNILVVANYTGSCPEGTASLAISSDSSWGAGFTLRQDKVKSALQKVVLFLRLVRPINPVGLIWRHLVEALFDQSVFAAGLPEGDPWCVWPGTTSVVTEGTGTSQRTRVNFSPTKAFDASKEYRVLVLGDNPTSPNVEGILSLRGAPMGGGILRSEYPGAYRSREIYQWSFVTGRDVCALAKVTVTPEFYLFTKSSGVESQRRFEAEARDAADRPITRLPGVYWWEYQDWLSNDTSVVQIETAGHCSAAPGTSCTSDADCGESDKCSYNSSQTATAQNKNGEAEILVSVKITTDKVFTPSTVGRIKNGRANVIVYLCENPWPDDFGITTEGLVDEDYHFKTYFCQDRGEFGEGDDFYPLKEPVVNNPPERTGGDDLLREYFLFIDGKYCTLSKIPCGEESDCGPDGGSCQASSDVIGIRIYENRNHLSLTDWYAAQGFRHEAPITKSLDGYEAIQDGRTIYVSAANQANGADGTNPAIPDFYTNVYLISYSEGAHPDTLEIYNMLVNNWRFNTNLDNEKVCRRGSGETVRIDGQPVSCSSDLDCPRLGDGEQTECFSPKDKITRDVKRLIDVVKIKSAVENYRLTKRHPPRLEAGTYVRGITTSRWDSWANVLATELGAALPVDPLNKFTGCAEPYSADTCWNVSEEIYRCPAYSHIYQYRYEPGTGLYNIGTDLEYRLGPTINPSWSWYRSAVPNFVTFENTCNDTPYSNTGICGDGIINITGVCARNTSRSCMSDSDCVVDTVDQGPCLNEQCEVGESRTQDCATPEGRGGTQSQLCDLATCRWPTAWTTCLAKCGNGVLDDGEACDRGPGGGRITGGGTSSTNQYMCTDVCTMTGGYCGDGVLQSGYGERCDDGANNGRYGKKSDGTPYCAISCVGSAPYCGDTIITEPEEECDGNTETAKGVCKRPTTSTAIIPSTFFHCGSDDDCRTEFERRDRDGGITRTYTMVQCVIMDDPSSNYCIANYVSGYVSSGQSCNSTTDCGTYEICDLCPPETGTGYPQSITRTCKNPGEGGECTWNAWGDCRPAGACGNGIKEGTEECDDGNTNNNDSCLDNCLNARCGDGYTRTGIEMCDAGAANGRVCTAPYGSTCNYCSTECTLQTVSGPTCGDGTIDPPYEQCDTTVPSGTGINWICVDFTNPLAHLSPRIGPSCSRSSCQLACPVGRACNNRVPDAHDADNADGDGLIDACDPDDNNDIILDGESGYPINLRISTPLGTSSPPRNYDEFDVYINGSFRKNISGKGIDDRELNISNLSPGNYILELRYVSSTRPPSDDGNTCSPFAAPCYLGVYSVEASSPYLDWSMAVYEARAVGANITIKAPSPFAEQSILLPFRVCTSSPCAFE